MMYMGVLVDGLLAEATVAVVHINMNSHGRPTTNGQDHQVQATAAILARPEVLLFGIGREVFLLLVFLNPNIYPSCFQGENCRI